MEPVRNISAGNRNKLVGCRQQRQTPELRMLRMPLKRPSSVRTAQVSTGQEDLGERRREPPLSRLKTACIVCAPVSATLVS